MKSNKKIIFNRRLRRQQPMTICVAVMAEIFEDTPRIVFVADRLLSGHVQFELGNPKIARLSDNSLIMLAGNPMKGSLIIESVFQKLVDNPKTITEIAQLVSTEYQKLLQENINQELSSRNLTIDKFYEKITTFPDWLAGQIDNEISSHDLELEFLVFGIDENRAHIFEISNKGKINSFDSLGFAAIGSGAPQSIAELGRFQYGSNISLSHAIQLAYGAKKEAQRVGTVGDETDLGLLHVIDGKVELWWADSDFKDMLDNQISKLKGYQKELQRETEKVIEKMVYKKNSTVKEEKHEPE